MKKLIIILVVLVAICSLMYISVCNDRTGCICSILTTEDTKHPITSILESVWDPDSASEGHSPDYSQHASTERESA